MNMVEKISIVQTALHTARQKVNEAEHRLFTSNAANADVAFRDLAVARAALNEAIDIMDGVLK